MSRPDVPPAGDLAEVTLAYLDFHRATLARKAAGLSVDQLDERVGTSTLTLGGLLAHMAFVEDYWFGYRLEGQPPAQPWAGLDWEADDDAEFAHARGRTVEELTELLEQACERSREAVADWLGQPDAWERLEKRATEGGPQRSLAWIVVHMVEEYARHNGHADLLREAIDGTTGT